MQTSDTLFRNAIILTMDDDYHQYEPGALVVHEDKIVWVGLEKELPPEHQGVSTVIDCAGKVLMPGLVNTHTHVPMTLLRGLADDLRLDVWLMGYMMPVEREFVSPEFVRLGTRLACAEMIRSGVTTFADMYYFEEDIARTTAEAGMRAVCSQSVMKFPMPDAESYEEALAYTRGYIQRWKGHPLIVPSIAPHSAYGCTPEILRAATELAVEFDVPLHIHISETASEVENMRNEQGMPVVPYVKKLNLFDAKVIAAHCVHIDEGEIHTLKHYNAGVAHNPSSNLKLASGVAPVKKMLDLGLNVGIGTDGPASNNDLDMFEEMRLAAFLAKGTSGDPTALPAKTAVTMATRMGARALHLGDITGSLEVGKRADLILVDISPLHNSPRFHRDLNNGVYAQLVYAGKASDVSDVMVNGQFLMRSRDLTTLDEAELIKQSQVYAVQIDQFLLEREQSILSKLIAIGGAMEEESFEVQVKVRIPDPQTILSKIDDPNIEVLRHRHYHEYDTYFLFDDAEQGRMRFREDHFIDDSGTITNVRSRLTLIGALREANFPQEVLLSRSRYLAPATQSLRFYREYFQPNREEEIEKDRRRFLVTYQGVEFFINVDHLLKPDLGYFLEIKSRTWSRADAETKSKLAAQLITLLGASPLEAVGRDYIETIAEKNS
jgi:5-methylthioadenosine/S-adenosylhomocysteine deaminase